MQNYSEIIGLNKYFKPFYDITNENTDYWKTFIPNEKFYSLIRGYLNSLESQSTKDKKSIWVQGTYGTGKSHATGVIKHLLFEPEEKIADFINNFKDEQIKFRIKNFRKKHRVFPVVLKGVSNITNNASFSLEIEKAVKIALKTYGISINTESDFEKIINQIKNNPFNIDWDKNIESHPELRMYVNNTKDLISKLENHDKEILQILEDLSSRTQIHFSHDKIEDWLGKVVEDIRQQDIADQLVIYWDEFTSVLELQNSGIVLSKLQDIAELAAHKEIYLYVISHRQPQQSNLKQSDIDHILGRFVSLDYSMEPITTYHIIGASILKKDRKLWEKLRDEHTRDLNNVIQKVTFNEGSHVSDLIKDLFPIHPYTAYLATFIARNIGSTERSIFNFLYDDSKGFTKFISSNPNIDGNIYLTPDYLYNFFLDEFGKSTDQRFSSVIDKYRLHVKTVEDENVDYLPIFKSLLLLNFLYRVISVEESYDSLVSPNLNNLRLLFSETRYLSLLDNCLEFINNRQIIARNPDNLFLVESSALPFREIESAKMELKGNYNTIDKILSSEQKLVFEKNLSSLILRVPEICILDSSLNGHLIKNNLLKCFKNEYSVHIIILISKNLQDQSQVHSTLQSILSEDSFENIVFVILDEILEQDTIDSFLDYQARAVVADRHHLKDDQIANTNYATKLIDQWLNKVNNSTINWYLKSDDGKIQRNPNKLTLTQFCAAVNSDLSPTIFHFGIDTLKETTKNYPVWSFQMANKIAESYVFAQHLNHLEQKTSSAPAMNTRLILKNDLGQYIVNENLKFIQGQDKEHPLKKMSRAVHKAINRKKGEIFNLGDLLGFLCKPPFGLYPSMIHLATLAYLLRDFTGKLYESGSGKPIEDQIMRDLVSTLFEYWTKGKNGNKLEVRLGTQEEKELVSDLCEIFNLTNIESLNDAKWAIREWIKTTVKYPLWIFKTIDNISDPIINGIETINFLVESIDQDFNQDSIKDALDMISPVKTDLTLFFQKHNQSESLFIKWFHKIDNLDIKQNQNVPIIEYVRKNMPEEIGVASWKEGRVREVIKDFFIVKPTKSLKAKFCINKLSDSLPVQTVFIDESEGNPISWEWNFDVDGTNEISNDKYPSYVYKQPGNYTVSLIITDSNGDSDQSVYSNIIEANEKQTLNKSAKDKIINKIQNYKGDAKKLLLKILEDNEEFVIVLEKYLNNELGS